MAITSFIKPMDNDKGIFYTFQSARDDMSRTFNKNFRFSKFLLLRIPEMGEDNDQIPQGNPIQFLAAGESPLIQGISSTDYNRNLAESFQNYCLNMEACLINQDSYNPNASRSVTERVFWKWMKEMGAIRFRETDSGTKDTEKDYEVLGNVKRFVEKDEFRYAEVTKSKKETVPIREYNRVVKYVGEVGMVNSVKGKNAYTEVYVHVPTWVGNTPYVLFSSIEDDNYKPNMTIINNGASVEDIEYLAGRRHQDVHPFGLSELAYYDLDDGGAVVSYLNKNINDSATMPGRWFTETTNNCYYTDQTFEDASESRIYRELAADSTMNTELIRSYLDGVTVDFDLNSYKLANENDDIQSFADFSAYINSVDFEYNAVLLYYDILNPTTGEVLSTNLFGIQFLNQVSQGAMKWSIPVTRKYMPDPVNLINGNSFAYKFNLKFDAYNGSVDVERSINDYNTFSLDLYLDVLNSTKTLSEKYSENLAYIVSVKTEIDELKRLFIDDTNKTELLIRITKIEDSLIQTQSLFENTNTVMTMINELYDRIDSIESNPTYNIVEHNTLNLGNEDEVDLLLQDSLTLEKGNNYSRSISKQSSIPTIKLTDDLKVVIDDSLKWVRGQSYDMVFTGAIDLNGHSIDFVTDVKNKVGSGKYSVPVAKIKPDMLDDKAQGHFKFICNDQDKLTFFTDKIN